MQTKTAMNCPSTFLGYSERLQHLIGSGSQGTWTGEFNSLAIQLFELQFAHVPLYRRFCEARGVLPDRIRTWQEIPALPVSAFKEFEVSSLPPADRTRVFLSSGTSGASRSRQYHSPSSLLTYEASLVPWFARHLLEPAQRDSALQLCEGKPLRWLMLTPPAELAPNSSLVHMFDAVDRALNWGRGQFLGSTGLDGAWELDLAQTFAVLQRCARAGEPVLLLGTAFSFVHMTDYLAQNGLRLRLPEGSRAMETGGYKGRSRHMARAELHRLITERLGVRSSHLVSEYGMSELSSQAYDHAVGQPKPAEAAGSFRFPPWARVQVISLENGQEVKDGETGLVRVFDLANLSSVLAVQTEDVARRRGTGFELIGRAAQAEPRGCSLMAQALPTSP